MQNKLRGWLADNSLTADPKDRILVLESAGNAGPAEIYEEMRGEDTGLRQETLIHVVTLYERIVARFLMNGYNVNTGLFHAVPRFTGIIEKGLWNPEKNGIYVSFTQDKVLREEIAKTEIVIKGEKADVMYITGVEDRSNNMTDGSMTPGRNFAVFGAYLRVVGDNEAVGITFRNTADDSVVKLGNDMFSTNDPGKLIFIVPANLADGEYELTVTTQYMKGKNALRKSPRSVSTTVFVKTVSDDDDDRPVIE
ncbi:DNA-binding domain-containing protein [Parabacteroides sp.]